MPRIDRQAAKQVPITLMGYRCSRCAHEWVPMKSSSGPPRVCPRCKSPYWDRPRERGQEETLGPMKRCDHELMTDKELQAFRISAQESLTKDPRFAEILRLLDEIERLKVAVAEMEERLDWARELT